MDEKKSGLTIERHFSDSSKYFPINWTKSDVDITDESGKKLFTQKDIEFPSYFSELSKKIVSSRYFYGEPGTSERESSYKQLVERVTDKFGEWSTRQNYFDKEQAKVFSDELARLSYEQRIAFNSPVWFNVGTDRFASARAHDKKAGYTIKNNKAVAIEAGETSLYPQTSACFILGVEDTMESIMELAVKEAALFKNGSGTGTDLSTLRSAREKLSGGGKPSGPMPYEIFYDKVAGIVKSGGKTRRAAKMNSLKDSHPDIEPFIDAKKREQEKIEILIDNGIPWKEAIDTVSYQNANFSVRLSDDFMKAVVEDKEWQTIPVHNKEMLNQMPKYKARYLFRKIAEGTHACGDPGVQFDTTINNWHTCPNSERINASNPCSEYMFINDSSCNLASLNLRSFMNSDRTFNIEDFERAVRLTAIAQDLEFDNSSFPTEKIAENSHKFRPLGMGYANLGSLVMSLGLPYDSDEARAIAASITALMTGKAYETSTEMAEKLGTFEEYEKNKEPMLNVIHKHKDALKTIDRTKLPKGLENILDRAEKTWDKVEERGRIYGFRNAQATVLAPTGTIGFMMDCDTKGVEPEIGLVQTKLLAEGGTLTLVNGTVPLALRNLGYDDNQIKTITNYIRENQTVEESEIKPEHLAIFDCANKPKIGKRTISPMGHIKMMAAVQPFLSGAISKTVNMPEEATVEDIADTYMEAWRLGLKAVAIYRDKTKRMQPLSFEEKKLEEKLQQPVRRKLPNTRNAIVHKFEVGPTGSGEGYITIGKYDDGKPGELFITMSKEGSTVGGLMDTIGTLTSMALQYGVPLEALVKKFRHQKFDPSGMVYTGRKNIKTADSVIDYIFHYMGEEFGIKEEKPDEPKEEKNQEKRHADDNDGIEEKITGEHGGFCPVCGKQMHKKGNCSEICSCGYLDLSGCGS